MELFSCWIGFTNSNVDILWKYWLLLYYVVKSVHGLKWLWSWAKNLSCEIHILFLFSLFVSRCPFGCGGHLSPSSLSLCLYPDSQQSSMVSLVSRFGLGLGGSGQGLGAWRRKKSHNEELPSTPAAQPVLEPLCLSLSTSVPPIFSRLRPLLFLACLISPLLSSSNTQPLWLSVRPAIVASALLSWGSSLPGASPQPPPPCPGWPTVNGRQAAWLPQSSRKLQQQGLGLYGAAGWLCQKSCQAKDERPLPVRYWGTE